MNIQKLYQIEKDEDRSIEPFIEFYIPPRYPELSYVEVESPDKDSTQSLPDYYLVQPAILVEVKGLQKHFGPIKAVDGINFKVRRGEVLGFLGPNGAGKTTAMQMITGFLEPDAGTVKIAGFDLGRNPLDIKRKIGYLPENAPSYGEMTVKGFLDFVLEVRGVGKPKEALERVVERTGLASVFHQTIETLRHEERLGVNAVIVYAGHFFAAFDLDVYTHILLHLRPAPLARMREWIKRFRQSKTRPPP